MIKNNNSAFTLIETMLVIIIISLLTAFFPFTISGLYDVTLKPTAEKIVYDMRWARLQAIINNEKYHFRIYSKDNIYKIDRDNRIDYILYTVGEKDNMIVKKEGDYSGNFILYKNKNPVKINDDYYDRISFSAYGTSRTGTIVFKTKDGKMIKIVVNSMGRVKIER